MVVGEAMAEAVPSWGYDLGADRVGDVAALLAEATNRAIDLRRKRADDDATASRMR